MHFPIVWCILCRLQPDNQPANLQSTIGTEIFRSVVTKKKKRQESAFWREFEWGISRACVDSRRFFCTFAGFCRINQSEIVTIQLYCCVPGYCSRCPLFRLKTVRRVVLSLILLQKIANRLVVQKLHQQSSTCTLSVENSNLNIKSLLVCKP